MLLEINEKVVWRQANQFTEPKERIHRVGTFKCDQCEKQFEVECCLEQKLTKAHHFCSRKCQGLARRAGGCLNYVYSMFTNPYSLPEVQAKIKRTMTDRYGASSTWASKSLRTKCELTMLERYGGKCSMNAPTIKQKIDFKAIAKKRHETMKRTGAYKQSREELAFGLYLERFGCVKKSVLVNNGRWPIDFFLSDHGVYVQYDGVYWHGLDRSLDIIAEHNTPRDVVIHKKWLTDREQEQWFSENQLKLVRVPSTEFNKTNVTCQYFERALEAFVSPLLRQ